MEIYNTPVLGGPAPRHAWRTANKLISFAAGWGDSIQHRSEHRRWLDVGCGSGFITELLAPGFDEAVGIDVEKTRLEDFRARTGTKSKFQILLMSAARIQFPDGFSHS